MANQRIEVGTQADPEDAQQSIVVAAIRLEPGGDWYKLEEMRELLHEASADDLRMFSKKFRELADRIGALFEDIDLESCAQEIEDEDKNNGELEG